MTNVNPNLIIETIKTLELQARVYESMSGVFKRYDPVARRDDMDHCMRRAREFQQLADRWKDELR